MNRPFNFQQKGLFSSKTSWLVCELLVQNTISNDWVQSTEAIGKLAGQLKI